MKNVSRTIGTNEFDGLITDTVPAVQTRGRTLAGLTAAVTLKRGTVLGVGSDGKCRILAAGNTLTPDSILCDDVTVGTADTTTVVYTAGCFDPDKVTVAADYTMTASNLDELRKRGIVFKAAMAAK